MYQNEPTGFVRAIQGVIHALTGLIAAFRGTPPPSAPPAGTGPAPPPGMGTGPGAAILSDGHYTLHHAGIAGIGQPGHMDVRGVSPGVFHFSSTAQTAYGPAHSQGVIRQQGGHWLVETTQSSVPGLAGSSVPNQVTVQGNVVSFSSQYGTLSWAKS
jgi:hypothetical protein